ncbi:MAG TPA: TatD family hydrolase [Candidatus Paceibacterota bacterium]
MPKYFDFHSHLNFPEFETDFDEVLDRMRETETHTVVVGIDYESSKQAVELAEKYEEIYACIGVHPVTPLPTLPLVRGGQGWGELVKHPKVVMIGECGFDFYHTKKEEDYERQKKLFIDQIEFALEHNKPIMVHARNAYQEVVEIIAEYPDLHGNIHFFTGTLEEARKFVDLNFTLSFAGPVTFARNYDEVIKGIPIEHIISETDSPYAAPAPYRGKRNEPSFVQEVVKKIAEVRNEDFEETRETLVNNAIRMIGFKSL